MPLDTSIVSRIGQGVEPIKSPLESYSKILGIRGQQQDQKLGRQTIESNRATMERNARADQELARKQQQAQADALRDRQEEDTIHGIIASSGSLDKALPEIRKVARVKTYLDLETTAGELRKAHAAAGKDELEIEAKQNLGLAEVTGQALSMDDATLAQNWEGIRQSALAINPQLQIPEQPMSKQELRTFRLRYLVQGASAKEAADAQALQNATDTGRKLAADAEVAAGTVDTRIANEAGLAAQNTVGMNGRTRAQQDTVANQEAVNARQVAADLAAHADRQASDATTRRGQNMTDSRARETKTESDKALSGTSAKLVSIAETMLPEIATLRKSIQDNRGSYRTYTAGVLSGKNTDIGRVVDQIADKLGRLRSGGAINKQEEERFKGQLFRAGDLYTNDPGPALAALDAIEAESNSILKSMKQDGGTGTKKVTMVAPDGQTKEVDESEVKHYESLGAKRK
tara:strand:+ start:683 stop:2062 length:1380 start_codon:yes stop_codon:yes gene_type:complete